MKISLVYPAKQRYLDICFKSPLRSLWCARLTPVRKGSLAFPWVVLCMQCFLFRPSIIPLFPYSDPFYPGLSSLSHLLYFHLHLVSGPFIYNVLELWLDKPVLDVIDFLQHTHLARSWRAKTWTSAPEATTAPSFLLSRRASKSSRGNRSLTHFKYQWKVKA